MLLDQHEYHSSENHKAHTVAVINLLDSLQVARLPAVAAGNLFFPVQ